MALDENQIASELSNAQREAIWLAWDGRCFYCRRQLDFTEMQIDHIIPQRLLKHRDELNRFLSECPVEKSFPSFSVNSYLNLVPSHGQSCNQRKGGVPFPPTATLFYIDLASKNLSKLNKALKRLEENTSRGKTLAELATKIEKRILPPKEAFAIVTMRLSQEEILRILDEIINERNLAEPLVVALGINIDDAIHTLSLNEHTLSQSWRLYDWLENQLIAHLHSISSHPFHYTEASSRNGETLSVRLVFPTLRLNEIAKLNIQEISLPCWELLEVESFHSIYGINYQQAFSGG